MQLSVLVMQQTRDHFQSSKLCKKEEIQYDGKLGKLVKLSQCKVIENCINAQICILKGT